MLQDTTDSESKSTITVVQEVQPPLIPDDARVMTVLINHPPGAPGCRLPGERDHFRAGFAMKMGPPVCH